MPVGLLDQFVAYRSAADRCPPAAQQVILAEFIDKGHFARHIRQMRVIYEKRQNALRSALETELAELVEVQATDAGLHLVAWLKKGFSGEEAVAALSQRDIFANPVSAYELEPREREGIVLGYGCVSVSEIPAAVRRCKEALEPLALGG